VITSTDPDHLDIYGTEEAYLESFAHFTELIQPGGVLLIHEGLKVKPRPSSQVQVYTYSADKGDFHAANIDISNGHITFDLVTPVSVIRHISLGVPVEINIDNTIAAVAAVLLTRNPNISPEHIREAMSTFQGAKRRFEYWLKEPNKVIIDDYAHHPDELRASIRSVRKLYPNLKLTVAFQPHLFTRTRDFAPDFAEALSHADRVLLLPIYPAREEPIEGVTSQIILDRISVADKRIVQRAELVQTLKECNIEVLLTVGAGDINLLLPEIVAACR
jgi:UDP-N-acetylmuramate--alanine ligase